MFSYQHLLKITAGPNEMQEVGDLVKALGAWNAAIVSVIVFALWFAKYYVEHFLKPAHDLKLDEARARIKTLEHVDASIDIVTQAVQATTVTAKATLDEISKINDRLERIEHRKPAGDG